MNFGLDDSDSDPNSSLHKMITFLSYVEFVILIFFAIEILGNIYVYSIKVSKLSKYRENLKNYFLVLF